MYKIYDNCNEEIVTLENQNELERFASFYDKRAILIKETPRELLENRGHNTKSLTVEECVLFAEKITMAARYGWDTPLYTMYMEDNSGWRETAFEALALFFKREKGWNLVKD